jgi:hypothetical protein
MTTITALPDAPTRADPTNFSAKGDALMTALPTFVTECNLVAGEINVNATAASTSAGTATTQAGNATAQAGYALGYANAAAASAATALNAPGTSATSTSSLLIGTGSKSLTIQTGKSIAVGASVIIAYTTTPANRMSGVVTAYDSGTGALTVTVDSTSGSGTYTAWTVSLGSVGADLSAYATKTGTDAQLSRQMLIDCGYTVVDKGNSGTSTQTYDYTAGSVQTSTATGNHTIATSNWPPTGNLGEILIILTNGGAYTLTWPTINWILPTGATSTSISTYLAALTGRTALQSSGVDQVLLWSRDAGTTIYGKLV